MKTKIFFIIIFLIIIDYAQAQNLVAKDDYSLATTVLVKWFIRSFAHYDYMPAGPLSRPRQGKKFMIVEGRETQNASDYGISHSRAYLGNKVKNAFNTMRNTNNKMPENYFINRGHLSLGFGHIYDLSLSYMMVPETGIKGIGIGLKKQLLNLFVFSFSGKITYSYVWAERLLNMHVVTTEFATSIYLIYLQPYLGIRNYSGVVDYKSDSQTLKIAKYKDWINLDELRVFYGVVARFSTNLRITFEANKLQDRNIYSLKLSLKFNSLLPESFKGWFRDPRYRNEI